MSRLLTVREVCERSLRQVGAYAITDSAADPEHLQEAINWLDMLVAHYTGRQRCWWLVPATISFTLTAGQNTYDLHDAMGASKPATGVQFVHSAAVTESGASDSHPLEVIGRTQWEEIPDKTIENRPTKFYVDRLSDPTLYVFPTPPTSPAMTLAMVAQSYAKDLTSGTSEQATGFRAAWNLWLVTALSARIGAGPVARLPDGEVRDMRDEADKLWLDLQGFDMQEQPMGVPRLAYNNAAF